MGTGAESGTGRFEDRASALLLRLAGTSGREADPASVRDAIGRAVRLHPGSWESSWTARLAEAGTDFGLRLDAFGSSPGDAFRSVSGGRSLLGFAPGEGLFLLVRDGDGRVLLDPGTGGARPVNAEALASLMGGPLDVSLQAWMSCLPAYPCDGLSARSDGHGHEDAGHAPSSPWQRLKGFLRPEAGLIRAIVVYSIVVGIFALAVPLTVDALISAVAFGGFLQPVLVLSSVLLGALVLSGVFRALQAYLSEVIQRRLFLRLASDLAFRLPRVRMEAHDRHYGPELVNRFFDVTVVQKTSALILLDGVNVVLGALIGMTVLAFYHPLLLAFSLVLLAATSLIVFGPAGRAVGLAVEESRVKYRIAGWLEDLARHPVSFMGPGGRRFALERLEHLASDWLQARRRHFRVLLLQVCGGLGLQALAATALLALGGILVIEGTLSLGQLVAAELIVSAVVGAIAKLGKHLEGWYDMLAAVEKLGHLTDLPLEEPRGDAPVPVDRSGGAEVRAENLAYAYVPGQPVFTGLSFEIPAGSRTALVGPACSGASTLLQILYGLRRPAAGQIRLDGFDLHEWNLQALRGRLGFVGGVEIVEGTILENVRFGRPDISVQDARAALESAGLWEAVRRLPEGLHTRLTPWGDPLSATQSGLLMIARALAGRPRLLLLDGILDGLDDARRAEVAGRLFERSKELTIVLKTRMPDLVARCDRKIELKSVHGPEVTHGSS